MGTRYALKLEKIGKIVKVTLDHMQEFVVCGEHSLQLPFASHFPFSKFTEKEGVQKIRLQGLDLFAGNDQSRNDLSLIVGIEHEKPGVFCGQKESHPRYPPLLSGHSVALVHLVK